MLVPPIKHPHDIRRSFERAFDRFADHNQSAETLASRRVIPSLVNPDRAKTRSNVRSLTARLRGKKRKQDGTCTQVRVNCSAENLLAVEEGVR
jgi:hypothetical protein